MSTACLICVRAHTQAHAHAHAHAHAGTHRKPFYKDIEAINSTAAIELLEIEKQPQSHTPTCPASRGLFVGRHVPKQLDRELRQDLVTPDQAFALRRRRAELDRFLTQHAVGSVWLSAAIIAPDSAICW